MEERLNVKNKKGYWSGKKRSEETKEKISKTKLGVPLNLDVIERRKKLFAEGKIVAWNKGLSKNNSEILEKNGSKISKVLKEKYKSGEVKIWNKGLPMKKETKENLAEIYFRILIIILPFFAIMTFIGVIGLYKELHESTTLTFPSGTDKTISIPIGEVLTGSVNSNAINFEEVRKLIKEQCQ